MNEIRTKIYEGGRVIIPAAVRQCLHLSVGDDIILQVKDDEIHILTPQHALHKLQTQVKNFTDAADKPISLVNDLLAMRRREAEHE